MNIVREKNKRKQKLIAKDGNWQIDISGIDTHLKEQFVISETTNNRPHKIWNK